MNPAVSVVIATYNYSSVLRCAIETVLWQSFQDFELIVVGDCCTDDSEEVVRSFGDRRIRWLNLAENSGSKSVPQNAGIAVARADLIAYLAHDDLWRPNHLSTVLDAIRTEEADFAHSVAIYVPPPGQTERHVSGILPDEFHAGYALVHSSVVHRKDVIARIGEWPDYRETREPGDHLFWTRAAAARMRFVAVPKLTVWKFNASSREDSYLHQRCDEQMHYLELIRSDPDLAEKELIELARSAMRHGLKPLRTMQAGRDAPPGAFIHRLRQIRGLEPTEPMLPLPVEANQEPFTIEVPADLPLRMRVGESLEVEVRLQNDSAFDLFSHPPNPVRLAYHWLKHDGSVAVLDGERSPLLPPLPAAKRLHYFVTIAAPEMPGHYRLHLAVVQEGVRWFDGAARGVMPTVEVYGI